MVEAAGVGGGVMKAALALMGGLFALAACGGAPCPSPRTMEARAPAASTPRPAAPEVTAMLQQISPDRLRATVNKLASFGTRHTLSDSDSDTRGIGAARRWLAHELAQIAGESGRTGDLAMTVDLETHHEEGDPSKRLTRTVNIVNVVAVLPGARPEARARRYYVVGHYDSRATDVLDETSDAPGANDDASGVAVVLELARVMSKMRLSATVVFLATAGEEQGLLGARLHAKKAKEEGWDVRAVLNDDIVGDPLGDALHVRVFSEGLPVAATPEQIAEIRRLGAESDSPSASSRGTSRRSPSSMRSPFSRCWSSAPTASSAAATTSRSTSSASPPFASPPCGRTTTDNTRTSARSAACTTAIRRSTSTRRTSPA